MISFSDKLVAARRRATLNVMYQALLAAALAGGVFLLLVALLGIVPAAWLGRFADLRGAAWIYALPVAAAVSVFAVVGLVGWRFLPDRLALARRADRLFGFRETVSTVTELEQTGVRPDSAVLGALYRQAEADGSEIEPERLVPLTISRLALVVPLLLAASVLVFTLTPQVQLAETEAGIAVAPPPLADDEREQVAQDITRIAESIADQVEHRPDSYMEAVARTLETLTERLATDPGFTREELAAALSELATHAEQAQSTTPRSIRERISEVLQAIAEEVRAPAHLMPEGLAGEEAPSGDVAPGQQAQPGEGDGEAQPPRDISAMIDDLEQRQQNFARGMDQDEYEAMVTGGYMEAAMERNRVAMEEAAMSAEQAQIMGGATESDAGESNLAGQGVDALDHGGPQGVEADFGFGEDLTLEATPAGEGRRFEMDLPPEAEFSAPDFAIALPEGSGWAYTPESAARRVPVALINRDAISIYLQTLNNAAAASAGGAMGTP